MAVAVAAPHPAAVEAAREVVARGGNAFDAALAAAGALAVAYPHQCSAGGDLVAIVRVGSAGGPLSPPAAGMPPAWASGAAEASPAPEAGGAPRGAARGVWRGAAGGVPRGAAGRVSRGSEAGGAAGAPKAGGVPGAPEADWGARGWPPEVAGMPRAVLSIGAAAAAVDGAGLRAAGDRMPFDGPQTITVPGVVAGWAAIAGFGARLTLSELLAPAVRLAAEGVPFSPGLRRAIAYRIGAIRSDPGLSALLMRGDGRLVQPVLAETLTAIGADWRSFYEGELGRRLAEGLRKLGSPLVAADLAAHRAEVVAPLTRTIGDVTWHAAPPPVQGPTFLAVVGADDLLAASQRARQARDALLGDPRTGPIELAAMLTPDPERSDSLPEEPKPTGDTVAVTAVDDDGNAVTLIQSVFESFGSGLLDPGTGLVLHNRGASFRLEPDHPGRIAPGSRPPHTLCPTMALSAAAVLALGCQGGRNQPWILAQVASEALDSADLVGLLTRPRWYFEGAELITEPGVDALDDDAGHLQVSRLRHGQLAAASDPRADGLGAVLGE
ncbi:gamma-glutamyltransferase [Actinoplanes subtropicus]|uniref:gamma-glutamyltransferase n=1 Tax=Actinoplanes subtropicus TaxID=543632 RepID=UPI001FE07CCD|nr:gamma-glutamyltransferase [Actinoplanes subtropicus]